MRKLKIGVIFKLTCGTILVLISLYVVSEIFGVSLPLLDFTRDSVSSNNLDYSTEDSYYDLAYKIDADCSQSVYLGNWGDGGYSLCTEPPTYTIKKDGCISMDFGINNEWSFEDDLVKHFGCQIYAFDPSMKVDYTSRGDNIKFYKIGLDGHNHVNKWNWTLVTLKSAIELIGLKENSVIDLLKIDIEGSEWPAFSTALKDGSLKHVKQIIFESHATFSPFIHFDMAPVSDKFLGTVFRLFREAGFYQWQYRDNVLFGRQRSPRTRKRRSCCIEHHFINRNFA